MTASEMVREIVRTLKYSKKSDVAQFKLYLKLVLLGMAVVGGIAFVIHLISSLVMPSLAPQTIFGGLIS
ncbi:MAG: preprotein translocase subunit SecE [Nitrososphaerota archaeon]|nr:preprotein translocase subunit SecE [Nitrososphaerota archaeon]